MKKIDLKNVTKDTWARTIFLFVSLINQFIAIFGGEQLPFTEDEIYQGVTIALTIISTVLAWWKNNSFSQEAQTADEIMKDLKNNVEKDI